MPNKSKQMRVMNSVKVDRKAAKAELLTQRQKMDHNAAVLAAAEADPWTYRNVRVPDLNTFPTILVTSTYDVGIAMQQGSGTTTDYVGGLSISARPSDQYRYISSAVNKESVTWGSYYDATDVANISSSCRAVRVVSMGIRLLDYGKYQDRGVYCYVGQMNEDTYPTGISSMSTLLGTRAVDISNGEIAQFSWDPISGGAYWDEDEDRFEIMPRTWFEPAAIFNDFASIAQHLVIMFATGEGSVSDVVRVQILTNYEGVPVEAVANSHEKRTVVGGGESTAAAKMDFMSKFRPEGSSTLIEGVKSVLNHTKSVGKWLANNSPALLNAASRAYIDPSRQVAYNYYMPQAQQGAQLLLPGPGRRAVPQITQYADSVVSGSLSFSESALYRYLLSLKIRISPHHPIIRKWARLDPMEQTMQIVELLRDPAAIKRIESLRGHISRRGTVTMVQRRGADEGFERI